MTKNRQTNPWLINNGIIPTINRMTAPTKSSKAPKLRVLVYGRNSTDQHTYPAIDSRVADFRQFFEKAGITDVEFTVIEDRGLSGNTISRPGINQVRAGIAARRWDLILIEDKDRLFRNKGDYDELEKEANDHGIRLINNMRQGKED